MIFHSILRKALASLSIALCSLVFCAELAAQNTNCVPTPLFKAEVTKEVRCGTDGEITVIPQEGADAIVVSRYLLRSKDGKVNKITSPTAPFFVGLLPGEYTLTIEGAHEGEPFCGTTTTTLNFTPFPPHITEPVPPSTTPNLYHLSTRASFIKDGVDHSIGRLVLRVRDGVDPSNMRFTLESYTPEAGTTPQVQPPLNTPLPTTREESVVGGVNYHFYTIDMNLPAGQYSLRVTDGCLSSPVSATLPAVRPEDFLLEFGVEPCSPRSYKATASWKNPPEKGRATHRLLKEGFFELGTGLSGGSLKDWHIPTPFGGENSDYFGYRQNLTPSELAALYGSNKIGLRLASAPNTAWSVSRTISAPPPISWTFDNSYIAEKRCQNFRAWYPYVHNAPCPPVTYVVTKGTRNGEEVYRNENWSNGPTDNLEYGQQYVAAIYKDGELLSEHPFSFNIPLGLGEVPKNDRPYASDIDVYFELTRHCDFILRVEREDGTLVTEQPMMGGGHVRLNYDTNYRVKALDPVTKQPILNELWPVRRVSNLPERMVIEPYNITACRQHPWIDWPGGWYDKYIKTFPQGTRVTVTIPSIPSFQPITLTLNANTYVYLPDGQYPAALYRLHVELDPKDPNGPTRDYDVDFPGGMQLTAPTQLDIRNECNQFFITPRASIKEIRDSRGNRVLAPDGVKTIIEHWSTVTNSWYEVKRDLRSGSSFSTRTPGKYRLIVGDKTCPLEIKEFELVIDRPRLKYFNTIAYKCGDEGAENRILVEAERGKAPYKYQLFVYDPTKENNKGEATNYVAENKPAGEQVLFNRVPSTRYTIEITDACGERFWQEIEVLPLKGKRLIHVEDQTTCTGKPVMFNTFVIKHAEVKWYRKDRPEEILGTDFELTIPSARLEDAGTYVLELKPISCNDEVYRDEMQLNVVPAFTAATLSSNRSTLCLGHTARFATQLTGGLPPYSYKWEMSQDQGVTWAPFTGTSASNSYLWNEGQWGDQKQWRCTITDRCGTTITTAPLNIELRECYVPVNPHLMAPSQKRRPIP